MLRVSAALCAVVMTTATGAGAVGIAPGSTATLDVFVTPMGPALAKQTKVVGPGAEFTTTFMMQVTNIDINAGANGDRIEISAPAGQGGQVTPAQLTFDSLDFIGGQVLTGLTINTPFAGSKVISLNDNNVTIEFVNAANVPQAGGVLFAATYVTAVAPAPVPLPVSGALAAMATLGLAAASLRRRRRADRGLRA